MRPGHNGKDVPLEPSSNAARPRGGRPPEKKKGTPCTRSGRLPKFRIHSSMPRPKPPTVVKSFRFTERDVERLRALAEKLELPEPVVVRQALKEKAERFGRECAERRAESAVLLAQLPPASGGSDAVAMWNEWFLLDKHSALLDEKAAEESE